MIEQGGKKSRKTNSSGFTLLEVLVALSLLGIAIIGIVQLFSINLRSISVSEDFLSGTLAVQAKMREVLSEEELSEKSWNGVTDDGYRFEVSIEESLKDRTENIQVKVLEVTVKVFWARGNKDKSMTLRTLKMVQKQV